ncbi:MAG: hypothetical protein ACRCRR_05215, partial [Rickettsia sp.]
KILAGYLKPTSGQVFLDQVRIDKIPKAKKASTLVTITQKAEDRLFTELTLEENITLWESRFPSNERLTSSEVLELIGSPKRFLSLLSQPAVNSITINSYAIKVRNQRAEHIFDLYKLKETISKIFPTFITYTLSLNNHDIMSDGNQKTKYDLVQSKSLGLNNILTLQLKINRNSIFYVDKQYRLQKIILILGVSSFLIFSIFLFKSK